MRGYQKKVIYLKNMESDLFEEAYFVIKDSIVGSQGTTESLVDEANRIIKENIKEKNLLVVVADNTAKDL